MTPTSFDGCTISAKWEFVASRWSDTPVPTRFKREQTAIKVKMFTSHFRILSLAPASMFLVRMKSRSDVCSWTQSDRVRTVWSNSLNWSFSCSSVYSERTQQSIERERESSYINTRRYQGFYSNPIDVDLFDLLHVINTGRINIRLLLKRFIEIIHRHLMIEHFDTHVLNRPRSTQMQRRSVLTRYRRRSFCSVSRLFTGAPWSSSNSRLMVSMNRRISLQACRDGRPLMIFWLRSVSLRRISVYKTPSKRISSRASVSFESPTFSDVHLRWRLSKAPSVDWRS